MPQQELDLLKLAPRYVAKTGAGAPHIMRGEILDASTPRSGLHDVPDRLWRKAFAPDLAEPVHAPEDVACADPAGRNPLVHRPLRPSGDWDCADILSFAD